MTEHYLITSVGQPALIWATGDTPEEAWAEYRREYADNPPDPERGVECIPGNPA